MFLSFRSCSVCFHAKVRKISGTAEIKLRISDGNTYKWGVAKALIF
ncbi:hypothetical protein HMPREF1146_1882 [Prevotella sp. MSX73]|uniref:Uncharacterized protein n=1 Tax=Segatella buccae ATCC 33574 TaxID=873513 RepID=E6K9Z0_9BACT|nr:hypothetical protein HMPREF6485_2426 [Segatella buccae ATCC 33574]EJP29980.1 hypothetical protein HMPREF1146_1882 [Prevotella sp. MSX73]